MKKKKKKKRDFIFLYFLDAIKQEFIDISHTFRDATQRLNLSLYSLINVGFSGSNVT